MQGFRDQGIGKLSTACPICYNFDGDCTQMTIRNRSLLIASFFAIASVLYGAAKYYSPSLVLFVVEQSLLQKAPKGIDPASIHERFQACFSAEHDRKSQMQKLLQVSEYLEKTQNLSLEQLDNLLTPNTAGKPARSSSGAAPSDDTGQRVRGRPAGGDFSE
jgi:hypothetical protein